MTQVIDTNKYIEFVRQTTSPASTNYADLLSRFTELEAEYDADVPRLLLLLSALVQRQVSLLKL